MSDIKKSYRYKLLMDSLDRLERGVYCQVTIEWCCDTIGWMVRFRRLPKEETDILALRALRIMGHYEDEDY